MRCSPVLLLAFLAFVPSAIRADDDKAKNKEVEVKFIDGSTVRMVLAQESIDVVTKYGKLTVPVSEIRGIDLGLHQPEGMEAKIDVLVKQLGSDKFKDRDAALAALVELGPRSYAALVEASKTTDLEVQQRIQTALKKIRSAVPENMLRTSTQDRIITTQFPIIGRIVSPSFKAKNPYFGDLDLKLTELRSIAWIGGKSDLEVTVDAAKYAMRNQWLDTGLTLDGNSGLTITATGQVDLLNDGSGEYVCGPTGTPSIGRKGPNNRLPGTLVGKIGENGQPFTIGDRYSALSASAGKLYLQITPVPFNNGQQPSGQFKAVIRSGFFLGQ